jgi:hypothetical protein
VWGGYRCGGCVYGGGRDRRLACASLGSVESDGAERLLIKSSADERASSPYKILKSLKFGDEGLVNEAYQMYPHEGGKGGGGKGGVGGQWSQVSSTGSPGKKVPSFADSIYCASDI